MKKRLCFLILLLSAAVMTCFTSCGNDEKATDAPYTETETIDGESADETPSQIKDEQETSAAENGNAGENDNTDENGNVDENNTPDENETASQEVFPQIISAEKGISESYEWYEDTPELLARFRTSYITLSPAEGEKYPLLAKMLDETAALCKGSADTELENLVYLGNKELEYYDGFTTQKSFLDVHIRRSDSTAFSVLCDSYMDTMYIEDFRAFHGTSYDTQTGKELKITDVVRDMPAFAQIVENELDRHMWSGEYLSEMAVKDYFENRTPDGVSWCLDYNGVTVYFNPGDIAEQGYGHAAATVSFEEHPEVFAEKYTKAPQSYAVKLPLSSSNYLDINNDGFTEEFIVAAQFDEYMGMYSDVYIITSADFYSESISAYGFNPYYIKTADGRHLLYLFVEGSDSWHRLMNLYVYDITDEKVTKIGEIAYAPHHSVDEDGSDVFSLPVNPEKMYFDYFVSEDGFSYPSFAEDCKVGSDGLPEFLGDGIMTDYPKEDTASDEITPYIDSEYRTEYANLLNFDSLDFQPYFAVAFIGYNGTDIMEIRNECIESYFSSLGEDALQKIEHFDFEGDEWYLVVPRYKDYVDIKSVDGGKIYTSYSGEPFTVKCNLSDIHSNIEISTDIRGGHSFSPQLDGRGKIVKSDEIWDITFYYDR